MVLSYFELLKGLDGQLMILRVMRLARVARSVRFLRKVRRLWLIIGGIIDSISSMFWVLLCLLSVIYIAAVLLLTLLPRERQMRYPGFSEDREEWATVQQFNSFQYFGDVMRTMMTLFNTAILVEYPEFFRALWEADWYLVPLVLLPFVVFATF